MGHMGTHAASVALYPNLAYKPDADFAPIGLVAGTPVLIVAKKDFPPKDLKEFVTYIKANVATLNMAHAGVGSVSFTTCLLLNSILGVKPASIPFNGTPPGPGGVRPGKAGRGQRALAALVKSEIARWTPITKAAGPTNCRLYSQPVLHIPPAGGRAVAPPCRVGPLPPEDRSHASVPRLA